MRFPEKEIQLKDGRTAILTPPTPDMAPQMLQYLKETCAETPFLLRTPEECDNIPLDAEKAFLQSAADSETEMMILCIVNGKIAGNCQLSRKVKQKNSHRGSVAIALYKEFWNLGIGTAMLQEMITVAKSWGLMQLELEVIEGNTRAMALYQKMGFEVTGFTPNATRLADGTLLKEFIMVKRL